MIFLEFRVILPYSDARSWHLEGSGVSRELYAYYHPSTMAIPFRQPTAKAAMQMCEELARQVPPCTILDAAHAVMHERLERGLPIDMAIERDAHKRAWSRVIQTDQQRQLEELRAVKSRSG